MNYDELWCRWSLRLITRGGRLNDHLDRTEALVKLLCKLANSFDQLVKPKIPVNSEHFTQLSQLQKLLITRASLASTELL